MNIAQTLTRSELAGIAPSLPRRSVPVRLIRRVVDVLQRRRTGPGRRAVPARIVLVRTGSAAVAVPAVGLVRPRLPVRLIPRHRQGPGVQAAMAVSQAARLPMRIPLRTAAPATPKGPRRRGAAFYYRVAITAALAGAVVTVLGPATFATFSAATTNSAVLTTGTLVLGDTVNLGTECFSFTGGPTTIDSLNSNTGCTNTWAVSGVSAEPGQAIAAPKVAIVLHGSLVASTFSLYANGTCISAATAGETYNGGSNICTVLQVYVQQYTDNTFTTTSKCLYGAGIGGATCTGFDATHTLADFGTCHRVAGSGACAGGEANGPLSIAVPAGSPPTSYFKVFANLPLNVGNGYQGQSAALGFTWSIGQ